MLYYFFMATKKSIQTLDPKVLLNSFKSLPAQRKRILMALILVIIVAVAYLFKSSFIVAMVNNRPITRMAVVSELEKQAGEQALDSLITKSLVYQEASKKNVTVTQEEIDKQLSTVEEQLKEQGHTFDEALEAQGVTRAEVEEQARFQLLIEKLFKNEVKLSDKEVDKYIAENAEFFKEVKPADAKITARDQLESEKLQQLFQEWLNKAREGDNIKILRQY